MQHFCFLEKTINRGKSFSKISIVAFCFINTESNMKTLFLKNRFIIIFKVSCLNNAESGTSFNSFKNTNVTHD